MTTNCWLCPLCGIKPMPYGTTCELREKCENKPHITGAFYLKEDKPKDTKGKGISEISNEGM